MAERDSGHQAPSTSRMCVDDKFYVVDDTLDHGTHVRLRMLGFQARSCRRQSRLGVSVVENARRALQRSKQTISRSLAGAYHGLPSHASSRAIVKASGPRERPAPMFIRGIVDQNIKRSF